MKGPMTVSANVDRMEKKPESRLKRRNAMRRPKTFAVATIVSKSEQSLPEAVLEEESDSGPSSTKSSPMPSPISSQEGDDTIFDVECSDEHGVPVMRRFSSYDRAVGYSVREKSLETFNDRLRHSISLDDAVGRESPSQKKTTRSPFRLPWKARSRTKEKNENAPDEVLSVYEASTPIRCLPTYKRSRSKNDVKRPASIASFDESLKEDFSKKGVVIPKRVQNKNRSDSLPRRMAMCFPVFLNASTDNTTPLSRSISPPKVKMLNSLNLRPQNGDLAHDAVVVDVLNDRHSDRHTGNYTLHTSNSEPNLAESMGETSCLEDSIMLDLDVVTQVNSILKMNVDHVVEEITLLDCEKWRSVSYTELEDCSWMKKDKHKLAPNVMELIDWFNRLALTVATQVLSEESASVRARIVSRFIQIAHKLWILRNFNSLKAVLAGLQCTPVFRLRKTWKEVSSKKRRILRELTEVMSEDDNYNVYRHELAHALKGAHCVAFLGVFLTDVCQVLSYQQVKHQRQLSDGGETASKNMEKVIKQHRRCVSSEVGACHRIQTDTNPLHSYSQSLDRGDEQFFPHRVHPIDPVHLMDSGVGSSDSVGSEYERRELTCSVMRVGENRRGSPLRPADDKVSISRIHASDYRRAPSIPVMSTSSGTYFPSSHSSVHITTDWRYSNPLSDYELFRYGALLDVRAIWQQTERLALSRSTSPVQFQSSVPPQYSDIDPSHPGLDGDGQFRCVSNSSSDDETSILNKQEIDNEFEPGSPPILLSVPRSVQSSKQIAHALPERASVIPPANRLQRHETTPVISSSLLMKKELPQSIHDQLWTYQEKTMHYTLRSRRDIRCFLTNVKYNSEEVNYRLSLRREPRDSSKSTS